jgi:prolyl-tRNA editing enzyme YbaK/EbsC (Cys-tRNA(Pro) deacylase)
VTAELTSSALRVQAALAAFGLGLTVKEFDSSTRTAADAAAAIGCTVAQIAKSILFRAVSSDRPILVVTSGVNRVNEAKVAGYLGEALGKADAAFVRARTGFVIGGVPPVGHAETIETFIDEDLMRLEEIWAAAGTPNAVFSLTPADLVRITNGRVVSIT